MQIFLGHRVASEKWNSNNGLLSDFTESGNSRSPIPDRKAREVCLVFFPPIIYTEKKYFSSRYKMYRKEAIQSNDFV